MGQNFGTNGDVRFLDAETEGFSYCDVYPHSYIISWTPDTIILEVPGVALADKVPGSGLFRVVRSMPSLSTSVYSSEPIEIDYSLLNKEVTQDSFSHGHICKTHCDGITYSLHENLKLFESNIVVSLDSVFQELSNTIGLTINIDKDENGNYIYFDENIDLNTYTGDKNLIFATNNSSYLAAALPNFIFGSGSNDNSTLFINKKTLKIDTDENWEFSSTANVASGKVDFNATILHELGHALGQNHALRIDSIVQGVDGSGLITYFHYVDRLKIMNPFSDTVFVPYSSRIRLSNDNTTLEMKRGLFDLMLLSSSVNMSGATKNNSHITKISETFQFNENNLTPNVGSTYINISIQGGKPPFFYQFYREGGTTSIVEDFTNINSINIVYNLSDITEPGLYCIKVKDANNCIAEECYYIERVECDIDYQLQEIEYPCQNEDGVGMISISPLGVNAPLFDINWSDSEGNFYEGSDIEGLSPGIYYLTISDGFDCTLEDEFYLLEMPPTILGSVLPACSENDQLGSVELSIQGGVPPFSYLWNTGDTTQSLTNIDSSGRYTVSVTDACDNSAVLSFDVGIFLDAPPENYVHPPSSCTSSDGDIVIAGHGSSPRGGVRPYTYQWSTGQETPNLYGLGPGTYILTITDAEGCAQDFIFSLVPEGSPEIQPVIIMASCEGEDNGSIEILFDVGNHIVRWYNGAGALVFEEVTERGYKVLEDLPPGAYTIIVEEDADNDPNTAGCSSSATFVVEERPSLGPFISTPQITPTCYGDDTGSIVLSTGGGNPPYTYSWDNGEDTQSIPYLSSPAFYSVTVTDDCGREIIHPGLFVPSYTEITNTVVSQGGCPGMIELETSGGASPYTYQWSNGQTGSAATGLINGSSYQVTVSDANGCTIVQHFDVPIDEEEAFEIFISNLTAPSVPSATNGSITAAADPAGSYSYLWSTGAAGASVEGLGPGSYTVTATDSDGCSVARTIGLQSCYYLPGATPNFPDFEILATGGLFSDVSDPETTVTASIREDGETFFTEDIPEHYSIRWEFLNGNLIGNSPNLTIDLATVLANRPTFPETGWANIRLVISNGCSERVANHYLIICGQVDEQFQNSVLGSFFILEPSIVHPCQGFEDGTIALEIPNPGLQEVSVFRDGIELLVAGEGILLLVEETGLAAGSYNYQINIGGCTFNFLYSLKAQSGDLVFNTYDSEPRACLYDEFCNEQHVGVFQEFPFFDVDNASSFPCAVPLFCGLPPNDIFVGYETASPRRIRAAEYFRILQQLRTHPDSPYPAHYIDGLLETARARFDNCDKLRYCPASLDWISETITNGNVSDVSVLNDGFCTHVTCQSFFWNFSFSVCDNDLDFPSDLLNTSLDFEGNTCMPVTANLFELYLAWKNGAFAESDQFEGSALEAELALLDGTSDDTLNRARCATISYCNRDLNTVWNNTINDVECGYFIITGEYNPRVFYDVGFNYEPIPMCQPIPHYDPITEEITHETVHCRVGDGYRTQVIQYDYSPPPPPQLNRGQASFSTKKFVTDTFFIEKLSNFALHIDEGQRAPKGILNTDYDKDLYFDFNDKAFIVHKSKLPNTAFHIDDWDKDQTLFCTISTEEQEYKISFFDSLPRWESSLRADGELKIEHFSKTGSEVVIGGFATGALEFNDDAIANLGNRTGFIARLSLTNGTLTAISTIENINPQEKLLFSENENEIIYFTGGYVDGAIGLDGNNINMSGDSGIFVIKFEVPGQFTLVADIENGTLFDVKKISQSQAEGEFTLALSSIGGNSITIHNNGNQEQVQLEEEASLLILAFDENETLAWHKDYPTENLDLGHFSLANGENGDVFLGLTFSGALNDTLASVGEKDIAILKLNATGSTQWANAYGSVEDENVSQLMYDNGILFFGGEFSGSTDRIIGPYEFVNVTPYDSSRAYISLIDERTPPTLPGGPYENASYSANSQYAINGSNPIEATAIFPNPFNNAVHVGVNCERSEVVFIEIFNLLGKKILHYEEEVSPGRTALKVLPDHTLNNGIYHLKISSRSFPEGSLHKIVKMARY